ncbi:MAG: HD domain-containing phosphohydrolase [Actinomycetota bacterium]
MPDQLNESRILAIDDSEANLLVLESILDDIGFTHIVTLSDPTRAVDTCQAFDPDLVLLDLHMPRMSGLDVIAAIRERKSETYLPVLMLTADISSEAKVRALSTGANDFLTKPFDRTEVELRIRNLLQMRHLHRQLHNQNAILEQKVAERTQEVEAAKIEILERLAMAAEFRDDQTGEHTKRVGMICALVAEALGLDGDDARSLERAAPLHDVGKIGIPDRILLKPGPLTPAEFEVMKRHTSIGAQLLSESLSPTLQLAEIIAATHHERWDGSGYGLRLSGDEIPLSGRILAIADVFDALTHDRPYKNAWPPERALEEIRSQSGRQFDPEVVAAFLSVQATIDLTDTQDIQRHLVV